MTDILTVVNTGVRAKLAAHAPLAALVNGQFYEAPAPAEAIYPFVTFNFVGGGDQELSPTRDVDLLYDVACWHEDENVAALAAGYIDEALHKATLSLTGWSGYHCKREGVLRLTEEVQGRSYVRRGGEYRIRADET